MADNSTTVNGIEVWVTRIDGDVTNFIRVAGQTPTATAFLDEAAGTIEGADLQADLEEATYPRLNRNAWDVFSGYVESYDAGAPLEVIKSEVDLNTAVDATYDATEHNANYTSAESAINAVRSVVRNIAGV